MRILPLAILALASAGCDQVPGLGHQAPWKGWVYPNGAVLTDDIPIGAYSSLEECRRSARNILDRLNTYEDGEKVQGDYECGFKCKASSEYHGVNICEVSER